MKVSECDSDICECCGEPLQDNEFRESFDGPVCHSCEPPDTHRAPSEIQ